MSKRHNFLLQKCQSYYNNRKFGELDFVIEYKGRVLPIEVKSGKSYQRHSALSNIMDISNYAIEEGFVLSNYNVEVKGNLIYYPIYMLMFIENDDIKMPVVKLDDLSDISRVENK